MQHGAGAAVGRSSCALTRQRSNRTPAGHGITRFDGARSSVSLRIEKSSLGGSERTARARALRLRSPGEAVLQPWRRSGPGAARRRRAASDGNHPESTGRGNQGGRATRARHHRTSFEARHRCDPRRESPSPSSPGDTTGSARRSRRTACSARTPRGQAGSPPPPRGPAARGRVQWRHAPGRLRPERNTPPQHRRPRRR